MYLTELNPNMFMLDQNPLILCRVHVVSYIMRPTANYHQIEGGIEEAGKK